MKDIKSYIIGFLSAVCLFLFMGQTNSNSPIKVEIVDIPSLETMKVRIVEQSTIGVKSSHYRGLKIRD
jgi:hypothetical protein